MDENGNDSNWRSSQIILCSMLKMKSWIRGNTAECQSKQELWIKAEWVLKKIFLSRNFTGFLDSFLFLLINDWANQSYVSPWTKYLVQKSGQQCASMGLMKNAQNIFPSINIDLINQDSFQYEIRFQQEKSSMWSLQEDL